jgi:Na+/melibiose symporter-like transporter
VFGFVSSSGEPVSQPTSAVVGVALAMGVLPAALVAASTLAFRRYDEAAVARLADVRHHDPLESTP